MATRPIFKFAPTSIVRMPDPDDRDRGTAQYREDRDTILRPDIHARGILVALLAYEDGDCLRLFDGGTRLEVALLEGIAEVPVLIYPELPSPDERRIASYLANAVRQDWSPEEEARFFLETMRERNWTQAELCRNIPGLKRSHISKSLKWLAKLPAKFHPKVGFGDGLIPPKGAYLLCDFSAEKQEELAHKFLAGRMTVDLLEEIRRAGNGDRPRRKGKLAKAELGGARLLFPDEWSWEQLVEAGQRLADAGKRGTKMPNVRPAAVLASLLKAS